MCSKSFTKNNLDRSTERVYFTDRDSKSASRKPKVSDQMRRPIDKRLQSKNSSLLASRDFDLDITRPSSMAVSHSQYGKYSVSFVFMQSHEMFETDFFTLNSIAK